MPPFTMQQRGRREAREVRLQFSTPNVIIQLPRGMMVGRWGEGNGRAESVPFPLELYDLFIYCASIYGIN